MSEIQEILKDVKPSEFITIGNENYLGFQIQEGPIKEVGVNGCQIDSVIETAKKVIEGFASRFPCRENTMAIQKLDEALMWMRERTRDRVERDVEGKNEA